MMFGRVLTAMVTPFNEQMEVDYDKAQKLADYLVSNGNDGIVVAGTTGESPTLSHKEKLKLFQVVKDAVGDKAIVIAGTGSNSTKDSIELTKEAAKIGVNGVMLVAPYYNKPSQEGLYQHFKAVAEAASLPVLLYNIPGRTGINIAPETLARLARLEQIKAVKEASGDLEQVSRIKMLCGDSLAVYSGDDSLTLPILSVGGCGIISVAGHIAGKEIKNMVELYFSGHTAEAAIAHRDLYNVFKAMFVTANPVPVKYALQLKGLDVGSVRLPLVEADEEQKKVIKNALEKANLL